MPELPEVETVRQTLLNQIKNEKIKNIKIYYNKILENIDETSFLEKLINQKICDISRYGKYLIFVFDEVSLIVHLRMEGKFFIKNKNEELDKHEHIIFEFESGKELRYHDTRKFGKMILLESIDIHEIMKYPALSKLGPEANVASDANYLYQKISKLNIPIKTVLLDQTILCGIGNIYADEICYLSKINPYTLACSLTYEDAVNILINANNVLTEAISCGGTTIRSYTSSLGVTGRFQQNLLVHSLDGCACQACGTIIKKVFIGGRGTYYCEKCQINKNIKIIGLTGIIASGKSTIVNYLKENNYAIIDTDLISREITKDHSKSLDQIMNNLQKEYFNQVNDVYSNNTLDRNKFRNILFNDLEFKNKYHSIIHPLIKKEVLKRIKCLKNDIIKENKKRVIFLDVPLLYEASFESLCDQVLIVNCDISIIYERLKQRNNFTDKEIELILRNQLSIDEKLLLAHNNLLTINQPYEVIDNSTTIEDLYNKLGRYINNL